MRDGLGCRDIPALNYCFSDGQGISTLISLVRTLSVPFCKDLGNVLYQSLSWTRRQLGGGSRPTK